jgi:membrane protein
MGFAGPGGRENGGHAVTIQQFWPGHVPPTHRPDLVRPGARFCRTEAGAAFLGGAIWSNRRSLDQPSVPFRLALSLLSFTRIMWTLLRSLAGHLYRNFYAHDAWALASHIALSVLLALFPFLIFITALASFFGTVEAAETVVRLLFEAWPESVAAPIATELKTVLTGQRRDLLTLGAVLAIWFASSGVEALRTGLNRAYGVIDRRPFYQTRLQSILFVIAAAGALIAYALLVVFWPAIWRATAFFWPDWADDAGTFDMLRIAGTTTMLAAAVMLAHLFLPAGHPPLARLWPGVLATLLLWLLMGFGFGFYLTRYASYTSTYAGFASAMIALVFLYGLAVIFVLGGELNAALAKVKRAQERAIEN